MRSTPGRRLRARRWAALDLLRDRRLSRGGGFLGRFGFPEEVFLGLPPTPAGGLRVVTLNVAHGRRHVPHQAFLPRRTLKRNLQVIAAALRDVTPDVVALQEADGPSAWSGNFDHVATLAHLANLSDFYRGDHNTFGSGRLSLASGTALLARQSLRSPASHRFDTCWRDTKGFVVATLPVPEWGGLEVDVVSTHLDFLRPSLRRKQIRRMVAQLVGRNRPLVVLGDLNCSWRREPRSLELLTRTLGLRAFEPQARQGTYPAYRPRRRLDWILISRELEFLGYQTVELPLSDHLGVMADLQVA